MTVSTAFGVVTLLLLGGVVVLARATATALDSDAGTAASVDSSSADHAHSETGKPSDESDVPRSGDPSRVRSDADAGSVRGHTEADADSVGGHTDTDADSARGHTDSDTGGHTDADTGSVRTHTGTGADHTGEQTPRQRAQDSGDTRLSEGDRPVRGDASGLETTPSGPTAPSQNGPDISSLSTAWLFANVIGTHGLFAGVLLGVAVVTGVSWNVLGVGAPAGPIDGPASAIGYGIGFGVVLYLANEAVAANLGLLDVDYSESLREALAPDGIAGWIVLLVVVLPIVAGFEELLFRAAAIGALSPWLGLSPWVLLLVSSVAFALGHGIQGPGGVLVTGLLGGVLGVAFVLTNSLLLVFVAHYVINALEFVLHEGVGIDGERWFRFGG